MTDSLFATPSWLKVLRALGFALFLGSLGAVFYLGVRGGLEAADLLAQAGWDRAIGRPGARGAAFMAPCMMALNTPCGDRLNQIWMERLNYDLLRMVLVLGFVVGLSPFVYNPPRPRKLPGLGRWATPKDLAPYLTEKGSGWYGQIRRKPIRVPENLRVAHTLVVGKPGHGKTSGYYLPNLLMDAKEGWSAIVYDLKYPDKGGLMEAMNYYAYYGRPVYPFTPWGERSYRINFLEGAEDPIQAKLIAEIFVPRNPKVPDSKEFYPGLERTLLQGLIHAEGVEGRYSLAHIYRVLGEGVEGLKAYVKVRPYLQVELKTLLEMRHDQLAGILNGARNRLSVWLDPALAMATEPGAFEVPWKRVFSEPSLVYIGVPQELIGDNASGYVLLKLLKRIVDLKTLQYANANGGRLKVPTSVYWDEFPNFGFLPGIKENLGTMRSRRVAYHIAVQNTDQGRAVYGEEEWAAIEGTFAQRVYFLSGLSDGDAERLSEVLGQTTVLQETRGATRKGVLPLPTGRSHGEREAARPLLSVEEMRVASKGEAVVLLEGVPPVRVHLFGMWRKDHLLHRLWSKARTREPLSAGIPLTREKPRVSPPSSQAAHPIQIPTPWAENPASVESLVLYLEALTQHMPTFKRYYKGRETTRLDIMLPEGFPLPEPAWAQRGWCHVGEAPLRLELTKEGLEALEKEARASYRALIRWCRVVERWYKEHKELPPEEIVLPIEKAREVLLDRLCGNAVEVLDDEVRIRPSLGLAGFRCPRPEPEPSGIHATGSSRDYQAGYGGDPGTGEAAGPEALSGGLEAGEDREGGEGVPAHHGERAYPQG
ncbi:type IV secretory system conjugative DNA transfer family protein [Thermus sp. NEB1569]|uniref:type IV secretory system conjugative DNA transfer family protein n=1 Tax=Thermus sp. NEB1569 TaxID=2918899 RepID=UPI001EFC27C0|nr:type IV secretory system conjugative DNA transfer family protein [Thermus sp. NEB1569]ULR39736.1 type IV secretory system conjugative DNA transfer family protein [Thermus sp. NEB1569]